MPEPLNQNPAFRWLARNAVVILPFILTCLQAVDGLTWQDALPVVAGLVLRQFFTSPTFEVQERVDAAHARGFRVGQVVGLPPRVRPVADFEADEYPPA